MQECEINFTIRVQVFSRRKKVKKKNNKLEIAVIL